MSTHDSRSVRSSTQQGTLHATATPNPFTPGQGFTITVTGGTPPYTFQPKASPPNPPGVTYHVDGNTCFVDVPVGTAENTWVYVDISDSAGNSTVSGSKTAHPGA